MSTDYKMDHKLFEFANVFQRSMDQYGTYSGSDVGRRAMALKVGICLIRYDLVRYIGEFETPDLPVYAKIRAYADAIRVMVEGKDWIEKKANGELRRICEESGLGTCLHSNLAEKCKLVFSLSAISKYVNYRHALSGHYDLDIPASFLKLCGIDDETLQEDTKGFAEYLNQWVINLAEVFESPKSPNYGIQPTAQRRTSADANRKAPSTNIQRGHDERRISTTMAHRPKTSR
jgi:hypothetical protein